MATAIAPSPAPAPAPPPAPPRRTTAAQIVSIVTGGVVALVAVGLLVAGGLLLWADGEKNADGYLTTGSHGFATTTHALATENLDVNTDAPSWLDSSSIFGKIRLKVASHNDKPVFVGIARTSDVSTYLGHTAHATVTDINSSPFRASYRTVDGGGPLTPPTARNIWAASANGTGTQELTWKVRDGNWSVVVMNADGSRGVDAGVSAGAQVPFVSAAGWGSLGAGFVLLLTAGGLVYLGVRAPRQRSAA